MTTIELQSETGLRLVLHRKGASIVGLYAPDRNGVVSNLCLSSHAKNDGTFSGATIAPVAGRICGGVVPILENVFQMPQNDGPNCLHSGPETLGLAMWDVTYHSAGLVRFQKSLADGQCGLPGQRLFTAEYRLCRSSFSLNLSAVSDRDTFVNMTNHAYWNLSGNPDSSAYDHELQIFADQVWYNDEMHLPRTLCSVADTAFDYRCPRKICDALLESSGSDQLRNANGYNNAFVLRGENAVKLYHRASGRILKIKTDAPCLVFYSGGYFSVPGSALAFEPQLVPDAPRLLGRRLPLLHKDRIFQLGITYQFGIL